MEKPVYPLSSTDLRRSVIAMHTDVAQHETVEEYVGHIWSHYRDAETTQHILRPIREQAQAAFSFNLDVATAIYSARDKATHAFREMPSLYKSKAFKSGVALGTAANHALLGSHTNKLLLPYIDAMMPAPNTDHEKYIDSIETIAMRSYDHNNKDAHSGDGNLHHFVERVGEAVYDDEQQLLLFKTGAALAHQAYRAYRFDMNQAFSEIVQDISE